MANRTMDHVVPFPSHLPRRDRRDTLAISHRKQDLFQGAEILPCSSLLKNRLTLTKGGDAGDRVISEARRIWSHLLLPGPRESRPNTVLLLCYGPKHHNLIHGATTPWRGLADEITRSRGIGSAEAEIFSILLAGRPLAPTLTTPGRAPPSTGNHLHDPTLFPEGLQELRHGLPQHRMAEVRRNLVEGLEREAPLVQSRMGQSELH